MTSLVACTRPAGYINAPLARYDGDTEYRMDDRPDGFTLTIYYSRYQFISEGDALTVVCKQSLTSTLRQLLPC
jgi:hypothetical protein